MKNVQLRSVNGELGYNLSPSQLCPKSMPFATTRSPLIKHELKLRAKYSVVMQ